MGKVLMKSSSIDAHHDPRVGEEDVGLLESFYVLVSVSFALVDILKEGIRGFTLSSPFVLVLGELEC